MRIKKMLTFSLVFSLVATTVGGFMPSKQSVKAAENYGLSNPRLEMQKRDCIEFGSYWQEEYTPQREIENPEAGQTYTDSDSNSTEMIYVNGKYFKKSPIKWQILKQDGDDLFLLADKVLDCNWYQETTSYANTSVTWETSTLRRWLNNSFYEENFSDSEQSAIKVTTVTNDNNPQYGTKGGNDTSDRLFLLSLSEIQNCDYGFYNDADIESDLRKAKVTDYAKNRGTWVDEINNSCFWWLRSPGENESCAADINNQGKIEFNGCHVQYDDAWLGVRPALHVSANDPLITSALAKKTSEDIELTKATWDTVEFGNYNGAKITWRVLSVDGDDAFLLADRILLYKNYNDTNRVETDDEDTTPDYSCTWETSSLREWLNDDFYKEAFSSEEQSAITETTLNNENNSFYDTTGGNQTRDAVYLLSLDDITNKSYGFLNNMVRQAVPTDSEGSGNWWLRTPGMDNNSAVYIYETGSVKTEGNYVHSEVNSDYDNVGSYMWGNYDGVRPALHLNLSSAVWIKGEEVTGEDSKSVITDSIPGRVLKNNDNNNDNNEENEDENNNGENDSDNENPDNENQIKDTATQTTNPSNQTTTTGNASEKSNAANHNSSSADNTSVAPAKVKSLKVKNKNKGKTVVSFKKVSGAVGYQIQYAKNKKFTKGKKNKTTKKTTYTIKKLKKNKTYYFRVRAYKLSGKKKVYGKWSAVKKLKIKK